MYLCQQIIYLFHIRLLREVAVFIRYEHFLIHIADHIEELRR